jgi:hypothetical protein
MGLTLNGSHPTTFKGVSLSLQGNKLGADMTVHCQPSGFKSELTNNPMKVCQRT